MKFIKGDWVYAEACKNDCREKQFIPIFQIEDISIQGINIWLRPNKNKATGVEMRNCRLATQEEIPNKFKTYEIY